MSRQSWSACGAGHADDNPGNATVEGKRILRLLVVLVALGVAVPAYVRLAPSDPARWHVDPSTAGDPGRTGVLRRVAVFGDPATALARFDRIAQAAGASVLAGSVAAGHITYVARSRLIGFPDYITVQAEPGNPDCVTELVILSRLRFGWSDSGVNGARLDRWFERLQPAQE
ncbi:MAG: DUF1499 domain-containing protein [Rhodobacter sp.]|nr:DUF1499 domain-containing protein [Rhodobacter sp.]